MKNKITEKLSKQISQGSLFENGMLLTIDEIYERVQSYLCNANLNLKTNWKKGKYKKFVNKQPLDNRQKVIHILIETDLKITKPQNEV